MRRASTMIFCPRPAVPALLLLLLLAATARAAPFEARLRDARDGTPLAGARIELHGPEDAGAPSPLTATTDGDGVARFPDAAPGRYRVLLSADGLTPARGEHPGLDYDDPVHGIRVGGERGRVELLAAPPIFTPTGGIRGKITANPGDRPVRDAGILVAEGGRDGRITHTTATNAYGAFVVYGIAPGRAAVTVTAPGFAKVERNVVVAPGKAVDLPVALGAGAGRIVGSLFSEGSVPIPGVHVTATRSDGILVSSAIVDVRGGGSRAVTYALEGVPALPPGSPLTYTVRAAASHATMTQPVQGVTGLAVRAPGQTVTASAIRLAAMTGGLHVTLYHGLPLAAGETESSLASLAPHAVVAVEGTNAYGRFLGESPRRFYNYAIEGAPSGNRRLRVSFPGHALAPGQENIYIPVGGQGRILLDLRER